MTKSWSKRNFLFAFSLLSDLQFQSVSSLLLGKEQIKQEAKILFYKFIPSFNGYNSVKKTEL